MEIHPGMYSGLKNDKCALIKRLVQEERAAFITRSVISGAFVSYQYAFVFLPSISFLSFFLACFVATGWISGK